MKENVYFGDVYKAFTKDIMHAVLWKFLQTPKNVIATAQHLSAVIIPGYLPNTPLFFFFLAALGLRCCVWAFSICGKCGLLFVVVRRLLVAVASLVVEHGL